MRPCSQNSLSISQEYIDYGDGADDVVEQAQEEEEQQEQQQHEGGDDLEGRESEELKGLLNEDSFDPATEYSTQQRQPKQQQSPGQAPLGSPQGQHQQGNQPQHQQQFSPQGQRPMRAVPSDRGRGSGGRGSMGGHGFAGAAGTHVHGHVPVPRPQQRQQMPGVGVNQVGMGAGPFMANGAGSYGAAAFMQGERCWLVSCVTALWGFDETVIWSCHGPWHAAQHKPAGCASQQVDVGC